MLIFANDISVRDHKHLLEDRLPAVKDYMEYQRNLFPYTIVRAGLDLAYKELDDLMNYVDNEYQPPPGSSRQEYPADIPGWYSTRFPWTSAFLKIEDMHTLLVILIKAMDSFRTHEKINSFHLVVLYDSVHNIVTLYNKLLQEAPDRARDITLSKGASVSFDDFINNYWPHLDFMMLSKPDYPHARHMERNQRIEDAVRKRLGEGEDPPTALNHIAETHGLEKSTLVLLRRDPVDPGYFDLQSLPINNNQYDYLSKKALEHPEYGSLSFLDAEYLKNSGYRKLPVTGIPLKNS